MKKKLSSVYMREVIDKEIKVLKDEKLNSYITFKHVNKTSHTCCRYINGRKIPLVSDHFTILEYSPCDELYNVRIFIDNNENIITYYFDIVSSFEIIDNEIYFDDLYLDILYDTPFSTRTDYYISLVDENELLEAFNKKNITKEEYNIAYEVAHKIMDELLNKKNKFVNRGLKDYRRFIKKISNINNLSK